MLIEQNKRYNYKIKVLKSKKCQAVYDIISLPMYFNRNPLQWRDLPSPLENRCPGDKPDAVAVSDSSGVREAINDGPRLNSSTDGWMGRNCGSVMNTRPLRLFDAVYSAACFGFRVSVGLWSFINEPVDFERAVGSGFSGGVPNGGFKTNWSCFRVGSGCDNFVWVFRDVNMQRKRKRRRREK